MYYEFIPVAKSVEENPSTLTAAEVEVGGEYELVISTKVRWRGTLEGYVGGVRWRESEFHNFTISQFHTFTPSQFHASRPRFHHH